MVWTSIVGALLACGGLFLALAPKVFWRFAERWKSYYADEPSDLYINGSRIFGVALVVVGILTVVLPFILK